MSSRLNDAMLWGEMMDTRRAEQSARNAWATADEWQAYAKQLEAEVKRLEQTLIYMKEANAGNLAEKTALKHFLAHATNGMSPMIADMKDSNPKPIKEHAKFLRGQLAKDAEKAMHVTDNWDVVRQVGADFANKIRNSSI